MNALADPPTLPQHANDLILRQANHHDLDCLVELISSHAMRGDMLPVPRPNIAAQIQHFLVMIHQHGLLGCGRLHAWPDGSAEVRSLAVRNHAQGRGIGRTIVQQLETQAKQQGFQRIFALTLKPTFFVKQGFQTCLIDHFPHKIKHNCHQCFRRTRCTEIAVVKNLAIQNDPHQHPPITGGHVSPKETLWVV